MAWLAVAVALLLPGLVGVLWLRLFWVMSAPKPVSGSTPSSASRSEPGAWPILIGYGVMFGLLIAVGLLWLTSAVTGVVTGTASLSPQPWLALALLTLLALALAWLQRRHGARGCLRPSPLLPLRSGRLRTLIPGSTPKTSRESLPAPMPAPTPDSAPLPSAPLPAPIPLWHWMLGSLLLLWIAVRLGGLALELWWQPIFPWDAWTTWALRARVWTELQQLVPFIDPQAWLAGAAGAHDLPAGPPAGLLGDPPSDPLDYPLDAHAYPLTVSLLAAWPTLAFGDWSASAAKLPWLGCALALLLGFYGQARRWGASPLLALVFLWLLASLPLLDSHLALAGYADLWLATLIGLAFMAFLHWARTRDRRQGLLALVLVLCLPLLKQEGAVWAGLFLPALLAVWLRGRWWLPLLAVFAGLGLWLVSTAELAQRLPLLHGFNLAYQGDWAPVWDHLFNRSSWHLFAYLLILALVAALVQDGCGAYRDPAHRAGLAWVLAALLAFYLLFFWTAAAAWALSGTSLNRILLQFAPALAFWMLSVWMRLAVGAGEAGAAGAANAPTTAAPGSSERPDSPDGMSP